MLTELVLLQNNRVYDDDYHETPTHRHSYGTASRSTHLPTVQEKSSGVSAMDADFRGEVQATSHEDQEIDVFNDVHVQF